MDDECLLLHWFGAHGDQGRDAALLACGAIGCYAVYTVTNAARHGGTYSPTEATNALRQAAKEAVIGHAKATRTLASRWSR